MLTSLLYLHINQLWRTVKSLGVLLVVLFLFVSVGVLSQGLSILMTISFRDSVMLGGLLLLSLHVSRRDKRFLKIYCSNLLQLHIIFLAEYFILALIPATIAGFLGNIQGGLGLLVSSVIPAILPVHFSFLSRDNRNISLHFIPDYYFELKCGIRQRWSFFLLFYLLGILSFLHIALFIISFFFLGLLCMQLFDPFESKELLKAKKDFLSQKISRNVFFSFTLLSPILLIGFIFQAQFYLIILAAIIFIALILLFSIAYKYANYTPGWSSGSQSIIHAVYVLSLIIPGFQLVSILLCIRYLIKAQKNLTYYYVDGR